MWHKRDRCDFRAWVHSRRRRARAEVPREAPAGQAQRAKASPGTEHLTEREGRGERGQGTAGEEGGGTERRKSEIDDKLPHRLAPRGRSRHDIGRDRIGPQSKRAGAISTRRQLDGCSERGALTAAGGGETAPSVAVPPLQAAAHTPCDASARVAAPPPPPPPTHAQRGGVGGGWGQSALDCVAKVLEGDAVLPLPRERAAEARRLADA